MSEAKNRTRASWVFLSIALIFVISRASSAFELRTGVPSAVGTELPANLQEATEVWLKHGDAETLAESNLHMLPGLAAAWLRGLDLSRVDSEALAEVAISSMSQTLVRELQSSLDYTRPELGVLLNRPVMERAQEQCPGAMSSSLHRVCDDDWLLASKRDILAELYELIETEVEFAAEIRLGDSDLGLEASNALCRVLVGDFTMYEDTLSKVMSYELGSRQHSLGIMAISCAYPELSSPYLLDLVTSENTGNSMVIAAFELARTSSYDASSRSKVRAAISAAFEWADPQQSAALSVADQIVGGW